MTIIFASHPPDSSPFMVADCLISNLVGGGDENIDLPSARNEEAPEGCIVNKLVKKLYILHPHVAVCWAGTRIEAKSFLNSVSELLKETSSPDEDFIHSVGVMLNEDTYRNLDVILSVYCQKENSFRFIHSSDVKNKDFPRIGSTYYAGSGSSYLEDQVDQLSWPENFICIDDNLPSLSQRSEYRALSLAYNIMFNECVNNSDELNLNLFYGGMVECCYFNLEEKTFKYIDGVKLLFWCIEYTEKPYYQFFFGHAPRNEKEGKENIFYFYENSYTEKGLVLNRYKNNRLDKTPEGHIVNLQRYKVESIVPSIFPLAEKKRGCYSINLYHVLGKDYQEIANRYIYIDSKCKPWITLTSMADGCYDLKIKKRALEDSKKRIDGFMLDRYRSRVFPHNKQELSQADHLMSKGDAVRNMGALEDFKKALSFYEMAKNLFEKNKDLYGVARATFSMGISYELTQDYSVSEPTLLEALESFKNLGSLRDYASCLLSLAILYKNLLVRSQNAGNADPNFFNKSQKNLWECLRVSEELEDKEGAIQALNTMSILLFHGQHFTDSVKFAQDAVALARENKDNHLLSMCLQTSGFVKLNHKAVNANKMTKVLVKGGIKDWKEAYSIFSNLGYFFKAQKLLVDIKDVEKKEV